MYFDLGHSLLLLPTRISWWVQDRGNRASHKIRLPSQIKTTLQHYHIWKRHWWSRTWRWVSDGRSPEIQGDWSSVAELFHTLCACAMFEECSAQEVQRLTIHLRCLVLIHSRIENLFRCLICDFVNSKIVRSKRSRVADSFRWQISEGGKQFSSSGTGLVLIVVF